MELNVGDYVRTKDDGIQKITKISTNNVFYRTCSAGFEYKTSIDEETNISPNIIDLIEVGDYVNGERVIALEKDVDKRNIYPSNVGAKIFTDYELQGDWYFGIQEEDIKSIVTKEQFEQMKYRVED